MQPPDSLDAGRLLAPYIGESERNLREALKRVERMAPCVLWIDEVEKAFAEKKVVIGRVIESYARRFGYGLVRDFTGHGIGETFHSGLYVPHYDAPQPTDVMEPGMTFTIEPMITLGTHEYDMWDDGWTVVTKDRSLSAQWEHTVLVTDSGVEVLTADEETNRRSAIDCRLAGPATVRSRRPGRGRSTSPGRHRRR